jgi:hypothetical protein
MRVVARREYERVVAERDRLKEDLERANKKIGLIRGWAEAIEESEEPASEDEVTNSYNSGVMFSAMDVLKILKEENK